MNGHDSGRHPKGRDSRDARDLELDLAVGMAVEGFRWVEWNHRALCDTPLHEVGRFVGHPGDFLAHLYTPASEHTALGSEPYVHLPPYSNDAAVALRVAERAGVFRGRGARLSCSATGYWHLSLEFPVVEFEGEHLPQVLARAALHLTRCGTSGGAP